MKIFNPFAGPISFDKTQLTLKKGANHSPVVIDKRTQTIELLLDYTYSMQNGICIHFFR